MAALANLEDGVQAAVFETLRAHASVAALVGSKIHDRVPPLPKSEADAAAFFPYLTIGEDQVVDDSNGCGLAFEVFVTVHVWSRAVGKVQAKKIGAAVRAALDVELDVGGFVCRDVESRFQNSRYFTDPDGLTTHGVLEFLYVFDVV